jgi:hypothetical protein
MMAALILVCSITTVSNMGDCTRDNALDIMYVPNHASCLMVRAREQNKAEADACHKLPRSTD